MIHDPSYVSGSYANADMGLGVCWVAHEGSPFRNAPIWNERRDACLFFSGESFMDHDQLTQDGVSTCKLQSGDPGYLLDLYDASGLQFLERLNGWFSGILLDLRTRVTVTF